MRYHDSRILPVKHYTLTAGHEKDTEIFRMIAEPGGPAYSNSYRYQWVPLSLLVHLLYIQPVNSLCNFPFPGSPMGTAQINPRCCTAVSPFGDCVN